MARKFQFRLEVVRKLREKARDEQRRVVAAEVRAVRDIEERIAQLTSQLRETVELTRDGQSTPRLDVAQLRGHHVHRHWLHHRVMESDMDLSQHRRKLDEERNKLGEATARLKAIEKLREKRWARHLVQVRREEQAQTDEAAVAGFARRRRQMDEGDDKC